MAKKAAKKTRKTQATKSKRAPSKGRKPVRRALPPRNDIGILSSVPFDNSTTAKPSFRDIFEKALGATVPNVQAAGYDHTALDTALAALARINTVNLIVTVGGVTPALRAADAATIGTLRRGGVDIPFVSLVGSTQDDRLTYPSQFQDGVDLLNVADDSKRVDHLLLQLGFHVNGICLLQNTASDMIGNETNGWPIQGGSIIAARIDQNSSDQDVLDAFHGAFQQIVQKGYRAVVISGDPYYTKNADPLVDIANDWTDAAAGRRVVYPFVEYDSKGKNGPPRKHTIHGPKLEEAFDRLGNKIKNTRWGVETLGPTPPVDHH